MPQGLKGQLPCPPLVVEPIVVPPATPPTDWMSFAITLIGSTEMAPATAAAARILRTMVIFPKAFPIDWLNGMKLAGT